MNHLSRLSLCVLISLAGACASTSSINGWWQSEAESVSVEEAKRPIPATWFFAVDGRLAWSLGIGRVGQQAQMRLYKGKYHRNGIDLYRPTILEGTHSGEDGAVDPLRFFYDGSRLRLELRFLGDEQLRTTYPVRAAAPEDDESVAGAVRCIYGL